MAIGVENLKKALKFVNDFTMQVATTKRFSFFTILSFIDDLVALGGVISSWSLILEEFKDIDDAEREEIYQYVKNEFDIPDDKVEVFIENSFKWVITTLALVEEAKLLKK